MKLSTRVQDSHQVVTVHADKLDAVGAIQFRQSIDEMDLSPKTPIVLDLSKIRFMDSSGIWAVMHLCKAASDDASIALVSDHLPILRLLKTTGIARFIDAYPTLDVALKPVPTKEEVSRLAPALRFFRRPFRWFGSRNAATSQTA